jgi:hypothetical protein
MSHDVPVLAKQALRIPFPSPIPVLAGRGLSYDVPVLAKQPLRIPFHSPLPVLAGRGLSYDVPVLGKQALRNPFPSPNTVLLYLRVVCPMTSLCRPGSTKNSLPQSHSCPSW